MEKQEIIQLRKWMNRAIFSYGTSQDNQSNDTIKDHYDALYLGFISKIEQLVSLHNVKLVWAKEQISFSIDGFVFFEPEGLSYYLNNQKVVS